MFISGVAGLLTFVAIFAFIESFGASLFGLKRDGSTKLYPVGLVAGFLCGFLVAGFLRSFRL